MHRSAPQMVSVGLGKRGSEVDLVNARNDTALGRLDAVLADIWPLHAGARVTPMTAGANNLVLRVDDGAPLTMYRAGVSAKQGGGVSWAYILRNPSLTLLIRRSPLGGIVAQARLGSEGLWRLSERRALDELDVLVRRMWVRQLPFRRDHTGARKAQDAARWQVSQVHIAVDVAHAPLKAA